MAANNDVKENEITQASAQATLANLKEIRVVTTDGSSKAYGKADFMAVIAAGIKSYFSSIAANNIAGILTADSGKAGISALADVAQVLGAGDFEILSVSTNQAVEISNLRMTRDIIGVWDGTSGGKCLVFLDWGTTIAYQSNLVFTDTKDSEDKINIYKENGKFYIQNKRSTASISILRI